MKRIARHRPEILTNQAAPEIFAPASRPWISTCFGLRPIAGIWERFTPERSNCCNGLNPDWMRGATGRNQPAIAARRRSR
jgi:hypothetical protein